MSLGVTVSLVVAALLLVILILALYTRHCASRDLKILAELAKKYDGKLSIDTFNSSATMDFSHRGASMKFCQRKGLRGNAVRCYLRCNIDFSSVLSMHIAKGISGETSVSELKYVVLMPKVQVGSGRFKKEFVVRGNNQSFLNALLAAEFEKQLLALEVTDPVLYLYPINDPLKRQKDGAGRSHLLEFSVGQTPRRKEDFERLIDEGLALVRRFVGPSIAH